MIREYKTFVGVTDKNITQLAVDGWQVISAIDPYTAGMRKSAREADPHVSQTFWTILMGRETCPTI